MAKKTEFRRYAEGTEVPADRSRKELEDLLTRHGATEFAFFQKSDGAQRGTQILYRMNGMLVRQRVSYPDAKEVKPQKARVRTDVAKLQEAEYRRRWRALVLIVKAKLEMISGGESTVEREFMPDILLADGKTVGEVLVPQLAQSYVDGSMPTLLLGAGS
jgi:hypothetical protein